MADTEQDILTRRQLLSLRTLKGFVGQCIRPNHDDSASTLRQTVNRRYFIKQWRQEDTESPSVSGLSGQDAKAYVNKQHCLAWNGLVCTICCEHCPEKGAIHMDSGRPKIVDGLCTGCRRCHDVCPSPVNAILMVPRKQNLGRGPL